MDYQKLIVVGNITRDAERKISRTGDVAYTTFRIGVSDGQDRTTFLPITLFGNLAEVLAEYLTKGRQVLVEGRITVSNNGRFKVVGDRVQLGVTQTTARP